MKKNIILSFCILFALSSFGQRDTERDLRSEKSEKHSEEKRKEIEAQKVAYITTQLKLTSEESAAFWPVYNEYQAEIDQHRKSKKGKKPKQINSEAMSEGEIDALIKERFSHQRETIDIEERYYDKFKKVLPTKKVAGFYKANDDFRKELLRSLRDRSDIERDEAERSRMRAQHERQKIEKERQKAEKERQKAKQNLFEDSEKN